MPRAHTATDGTEDEWELAHDKCAPTAAALTGADPRSRQ